MGHDLHRLAEIIAAALLLNDVQVYLAGGDVVLAGEADREVSLVVAKIEVDFAACRGSGQVRSRYGGMPCRPSTNRSRERSTRRARPGP